MLVLVEIVGVAEHHEQLDEKALRLALQFVFLCVRRCSFFLSFGPASKVPKLTHYGVV